MGRYNEYCKTTTSVTYTRLNLLKIYFNSVDGIILTKEKLNYPITKYYNLVYKFE